jgi:DNA-binding NtrC family response regulator
MDLYDACMDDRFDDVSGTHCLDLESLTANPRRERPACMQHVVGDSDAIVDLYDLVERVAPSETNVLVTGESGTGKELVARALHDASRRARGPFVAVNCGAIPEALLESELFGHARGAFTGAVQNKLGRIAQADGGTLFLDEIGELSLALQVKLLRVLQTHDYSPVGDTRTLRANCRIVAATNVDLETAVAQGTFREDLYYRLNVVQLVVPALRERAEDVPQLAAHFLDQARARTGRSDVTSIARGALEVLGAWHWPGNVRELENTIERAVLLARGPAVEIGDLPSRVKGLGTENRVAPKLPGIGTDLRRAVESYENDLIRQALDRTNWNKNRAAKLLGLNRTTLVEMLKRKRFLKPTG